MVGKEMRIPIYFLWAGKYIPIHKELVSISENRMGFLSQPI